MWQLSSTLLKKLMLLAAQLDCFGTKIKIKPIRAEIVPKQAYALSSSLSLKEKRQTTYKKRLLICESSLTRNIFGQPKLIERRFLVKVIR